MTATVDKLAIDANDGSAAEIHNPAGGGPFLLICDHASNHIPPELHNLGVDEAVLQSHVAWDPGAFGLALHLAGILDATLISSRFSRLVYDVNRPPESNEAIRVSSEIYDIPGNRGLSAEQRQARIDALYRPYHDTIDQLIETKLKEHPALVLLTIHSFTPVFYGRPRRVELGILHDSDPRFADRLLECAPHYARFITARNQPYGPQDGVTHTLAKHAVPRGLLNAMIEIRNDLIGDPAQQLQVAEKLSNMIQCAERHFGIPTENTC